MCVVGAKRRKPIATHIVSKDVSQWHTFIYIKPTPTMDIIAPGGSEASAVRIRTRTRTELRGAFSIRKPG